MYRCESWTIKKAEHQRIDAFKLWCWRRLLRVLWTARRSNQSILKKIHYFGHLMGRSDSFEKTLILGTIKSQRRSWETENEMVRLHHQLKGREFEQTLGGWRTGGPGMLQCMGLQRVRHILVTEKQQVLLTQSLFISLLPWMLCSRNEELLTVLGAHLNITCTHDISVQ